VQLPALVALLARSRQLGFDAVELGRRAVETPAVAQGAQAQLWAARAAGLMERLDMAVGMRLHFLVFAATAGVPVVALLLIR
jgi:hypothetical protein